MTPYVSSLDRICWTCSLCFDTAEELIEHRQLPEFRYVHDQKYIDEFLDSVNFYKCHWCRVAFPSAVGRQSHEMTDLIHWGNMVRGYRCEGMVAIQCRRCDEIVSINRWSDHERVGWGHNCCNVCELDFPHVGELADHIERFGSDGRHEWVCQKEDCRAVCCDKADLENHCYAWAEYTGGLYDEHANFQCEHCKRILGTLPLWQEHVKATHPDVLEQYKALDERECDNHVEGRRWYSAVTQGLAGCGIT